MNHTLALVLLFSLRMGTTFADNAVFPDYKNWPKSFPATSRISFQGMVFEADFMMYFNNELPQEASEVVADFSMTIDGEIQHYVQYVVVQAKDTTANTVHLDAKLYQVHEDKTFFRGTAKATMSIKEFHSNVLLLPDVPSPAEYDYDL